MATNQQKEELVEAIKGPHYYRITVTGYGAETSYSRISKEAHDFWKEVTEEHGDNDLVQYMIADDLEECEFDDIDSVPVEAQFLNDPNDDMYKRPWYESHTEFEHTYGGTYDSCYLSVDEVADGEYNSRVIAEVIDREDVSDFNNRLGEETEWAHEAVEMGCCEEHDGYVAQLYSSEKGCFFDGVIETVGEFDPKKLKFYTTEFLNGEDTITSIEYDGKEVDNAGGDTNGKGYYASVWLN